MAYFKALNYEISAAESVITFKGVMGKSKSQAAFLTFCTFVGLGSLGLVISILNPDLGAYPYLITLLSPYAGIYYWNNAQRVDTVKVKMETSDDDQIVTVIAEGGKEGTAVNDLTHSIYEFTKNAFFPFKFAIRSLIFL